jgi:hypothetical protein
VRNRIHRGVPTFGFVRVGVLSREE